jgi:hypothetical protein
MEDMEHMTELDRALETTTPVDWRSIQQIVTRQEQSGEALFASLERLVKVPRVPLDLMRFILKRIEEASDNFEILPVLMLDCVFSIWYTVLADRESGAPLDFSLDSYEFVAAEQYTSELLAVTDAASLGSNEVIYDAFQLTKLMVLSVGGWEPPFASDRPNSETLSFTSLVVAMKLPPMLLWLAVAEDPNCLLDLQCNAGALPLHRALRSLKFAVRPCDIPLSFPTEHLTDQAEHVAHARLLDLFNKRTPVQLLCHLSPKACCTAAKTSFSFSSGDMPRLPLDSFLESLRLEYDPHCFPGDEPTLMKLSQQELLEDIHAVISNSPMAPDIRSRDLGLYPFCLPQLQVPPSRYMCLNLVYARAKCEANGECFLLSLAYDLLRSNPTLLAHHLNDNPSSELTAHGKNLKQPLQSESNIVQKRAITGKSQDMESLKRVIAALEEDVETLKRPDTCKSQEMESLKRAIAALTEGMEILKRRVEMLWFLFLLVCWSQRNST